MRILTKSKKIRMASHENQLSDSEPVTLSPTHLTVLWLGKLKEEGVLRISVAFGYL